MNQSTTTKAFKRGAEEIESALPADLFDPDDGNHALHPPLRAIAELLGCDPAQGTGSLKPRLEMLLSRSRASPEELLMTLGNVRRWALEGLRDDDLLSRIEGRLVAPDPLSAPGGSPLRRARTSRSVTARQARSVLANAFLGNFDDPMAPHKDPWNAGGLDFRRMLRARRGDSGLAKMECLLAYFGACSSLEGTEDDGREITFDLVRFLPLDAGTISGAAVDAGAVGDGVALHRGTMESPPSGGYSAFVNFANANYGYGKFIESCTQEEILLMCCPELIVGMLFVGKMADDEIVNVRGVRRFCRYEGYLGSFRYAGTIPTEEQPIATVLTLDACHRDHLSEAMLWRDVGKAYHSFRELAENDGVRSSGEEGEGPPSSPSRPIVSTGRWGCGAFGGTPAHKMVQQAVAAAAAGVDLEFSAFGTPDGCDKVLAALHERRPSVEKVIHLLRNCKDHHRDFVEFAVEFLNDGVSGRADTVAGFGVTCNCV